jgi:CRISPR-associated protein Cmr1
MRTQRIIETPLAFTPSGLLDEWSESYAISLLTPMIGGGTESWKVDPAQPIRASEIKQQLRFWWRTMQDPATQIPELLAEESALFGDTKGVSKVRLMIDRKAKDAELLQLAIGANGRCEDWKGLPGYVLFPLLGKRNTNFSLLKAYSFTLRFACPPDQKTKIENAVTLWLLFGGLGARTRRGAGSLWCPAVNDHFKAPGEILAFLRKMTPAAPAVAGVESPAFPVLSGGRLVMNSIKQTEPTTAWNALLGLGDNGYTKNPPGYGDLRQGRNLARSPGGARPGRSHWPEADSLRTMSATHSPTHTPRPNSGEWFPRAAYGLPLQFSFNRNPQHGGHLAEPEGLFELLPIDSKKEKMDRWPSPLILKIARVGGSLFEVALLLNQRLPDIYCKRNCEKPSQPNFKSENIILPSAQPGAHVGKKLPPVKIPGASSGAPEPPRENFPIAPGHPHDGLFAKLFPKTKVHDL